MPACDAWMMQVPAATIVTELPLTVHTGMVSDAKLTVRPDDAVALMPNVAAPNVVPLSGRKEMVCAVAAMVIAKFCVASGRMPLAALSVPANVPAIVGMPLMSPLVPLSARPGGSAKATIENVGAGAPTAVKR